MADSDIPMAYATSVDVMQPPVGATAPMATATATMPQDQHDQQQQQGSILRGRSKRVVMQSSKEQTVHVLSQDEIDMLKQQGFTSGLIQALQQNTAVFPLRIWVVDNSGSMVKADGHRMISTRKHNQRDVKMVSCSRWAEIQETVDYHAEMARLLQVPTVFRLLNDPGKHAGEQQFSIGERGPQYLDQDLAIAKQTMQRTTPSGVTPLAVHVREIKQNIISLLPQLQEMGGKVVVVLATDGLPTDGYGYANDASRQDFQNALRSLEGLPVWIVVRLCTDEESIVEYYNELDSQLELSLEVLDDFCGEAEEVYAHNNWLNYCLPLHRMREMGFHHRLFDLLDERPLTVDELREFLFLIFGPAHFDGVEDPQVDFTAFCGSVSMMMKNESHQWNPVRKSMSPWIDMKKLKKHYGRESCSIM